MLGPSWPQAWGFCHSSPGRSLYFEALQVWPRKVMAKTGFRGPPKASQGLQGLPGPPRASDRVGMCTRHGFSDANAYRDAPHAQGNADRNAHS